MKSLMFLVLSMLAINALANEAKPIAICQTEGVLSGLKIELFQPFVDSFVRLKSEGNSIELNADFGMNSWATYQAKFEINGEKVTLTFSNVLSPSLGVLIAQDGREQKVACLLNH